MTNRYKVIAVHGEARSLYHVVDSAAPDAQQPAIVETYRNHESARRHAEGLNINIDAGLRNTIEGDSK